MKYKVGDVIKTNSYALKHSAILSLYTNKVAIIVEVSALGHSKLALYRVIISGIENRAIWINENEIEGKLE